MLIDMRHLHGIYIICGKIDLHRGIDGLANVVTHQFELDPCNKALYLFCGTRKDRFKALYWDGDGFILLYKRIDPTMHPVPCIKNKKVVTAYRQWYTHANHKRQVAIGVTTEEGLKQLRQEDEEQQQLIETLKQQNADQVAKLARWVYGKRSEQIHSEQGNMLEDSSVFFNSEQIGKQSEPVAPAAKMEPKKKKTKATRQKTLGLYMPTIEEAIPCEETPVQKAIP